MLNANNLVQTIFVNKQYLAITGSLTTAALLTQIAYWAEITPGGKPLRMRVRRDGKFWIAKTRPEWMVETGLTRNQYNRALSTLKSLGLVETKQMKFANIAQTHLRLLIPVLTEALGKISGVSLSDTQVSHNKTTGCLKTIHPYTETTTESTTETTGFVSLTVQTVWAGQIETGSSEDMKGSKEKLSVAQVLENLAKAKASLYGDSASKTVTSLPFLWKDEKAKVTGSFSAPLTGKEQGQLKKFVMDAGEHARGVMLWVLHNWSEFANRAHNTYKKPIKEFPNISDLLIFRELAVNMYLQSVAKPVILESKLPKEAVSPVDIPVFTGQVADPNPYKPSQKELEELLS